MYIVNGNIYVRLEHRNIANIQLSFLVCKNNNVIGFNLIHFKGDRNVFWRASSPGPWIKLLFSLTLGIFKTKVLEAVLYAV